MFSRPHAYNWTKGAAMSKRSADNSPQERRLWKRYSASHRPRPGPCPDAVELAAYIDGRASPRQVEHIEEHLLACPDCLQAVREARELTSAEVTTFVPPEVIAAAKAALASPAERAGQRPGKYLRAALVWRIGRWAAAAAAALIISYGGFRIGQGTYRQHAAVEAALVAELSFGEDDSATEGLLDDELVLPAGGVR